MREHGHHVVFGLRFEAFVRTTGINFLKADQFGLIQGGEIFAF